MNALNTVDCGVKVSRFDDLEEVPFPLVVEPGESGADLLSWLSSHKAVYEQWLLKSGAVLFRGFDCELSEFVRNTSGELMEYSERSSPRHKVRGNVYTSTDYPSKQSIYLHNEGSYAHAFPMKIVFCCEVAPEDRGATPIADCRNVYRKIDPEIVSKFRKKGILYTRSYGDEFGLSWQEAYNTDDKAEVEAFCSGAGYAFQWTGDGGLRTRRIAPAIAKHPVSGELSWFNHGVFFHISSLSEELREYFMTVLGEENLPFNTYYGDGEPIEEDTIEELRRIYDEETVRFDWVKGDILALENTLAAHSREPFTGPRKITVAMAEPGGHEHLS